MADALCGPSNPLQSFQKHAQVDRTLQQDRLSGPRHSPAQGFRTPDPRAGSLDAEFAAFEAGPANPFQFEQPFLGHGALPFFPNQPAASNWASDFQKLQISQPLPSQQFRTEAPLLRHSGTGWHNEFMQERQTGGASITRENQNAQLNQINGFGWSAQTPYAPMFQPQQNAYPEQMLHEPQHELGYSQMDFENAFADAFQEVEQMEMDQTKGKNKEMHSDILHDDGIYTNDHSSETISGGRPQDAARIGADTINYTEQNDRTAEQNVRDADELARTAGQLLSSVQHDTSTKFQESQFLALMRKIRDREVEVREEDFKSTTPDTSIPQSNAQPTLNPNIYQQAEQLSTDALRPHDPNTFQFPDLDAIYEPTNTQDEYSFDDDQFGTTASSSNAAFQPQSQLQALHPGGRWYPELSRKEMSGGISAQEFDKLDESGSLSSRYQKPTVTDAMDATFGGT